MALIRVENRIGYYDCFQFNGDVHYHQVISNPRPRGHWKEIDSDQYANIWMECVEKTEKEVMA